VLLPFAVACGGSDVTSDEDAELAYLGLDGSIDKTISLGLQGFNSASNANIDAQTANGSETGTVTIDGQVDQGASDNKTMTLDQTMKEYSDDGKLTYDTLGTLPRVDIKLSKIPNGTLDGTLSGTYAMSGDLEADVHLSLTFSGALQPVNGDDTKVERKPGTTHIVGTADAGDGTYHVDVTR
jgi:hypothetical protein